MREKELRTTKIQDPFGVYREKHARKRCPFTTRITDGGGDPGSSETKTDRDGQADVKSSATGSPCIPSDLWGNRTKASLGPARKIAR